MSCKCCDTSLPVGMDGKLMLCNNDLVPNEHADEVINGGEFKPDWCPKQNNYLKLKRIYELILKYEKEYGRKIANCSRKIYRRCINYQ